MESYKIKKGTIYKCGQCKTPLFELNQDVMSTDRFDCTKLQGIGEQNNPRRDAMPLCNYCGTHFSIFSAIVEYK
ncbi:MAG: hypothetical protein K0S61_155 [Anaerocolumna sp.]|jgi:DNA-directed RNA polymerase subunit RPC12/RpoP|nr:hypothetical protein [Anaerocolumna sp.]